MAHRTVFIGALFVGALASNSVIAESDSGPSGTVILPFAAGHFGDVFAKYRHFARTRS